jgi:hypothetical protein
MPNLGDILMQGLAGAGGIIADGIASNPDGWMLVALMLAGVLALSLISGRRRRRRR